MKLLKACALCEKAKFASSRSGLTRKPHTALHFVVTNGERGSPTARKARLVIHGPLAATSE
jgi:hypothetical protein